MVSFTISPKFTAQLKGICQYFIENRSIEFAQRFYEGVFKEIEKLEQFPRRWQQVHLPGVDGEFRRILYGVYQIFYEVEDDHITVHAMVDGRRRPPLFHPD